MVPSELGDWNSKGSCQRKYPLFSESLKAMHPAVMALGHFLLAGWQTKFSKILKFASYRSKLAALGYIE